KNGARVLPAPRRAPVTVIWMPSKNWKPAVTRSSGTAAAMTLWSGVKMRAIVAGSVRKRTAAKSMKAAPARMPLHPAADHPTDEDLSAGTPADHPTDEDLSVGTPADHPTDEDLSVGTPADHPTDEDLSVGTP